MIRQFLIACVFLSSAIVLSAAGANKDLIEFGKYLVDSHGCADCHSPKVMTKKGLDMDMTRYLSGHPAEDKIPEIPKGVIGDDKWGGIASNDGTV